MLHPTSFLRGAACSAHPLSSAASPSSLLSALPRLAAHRRFLSSSVAPAVPYKTHHPTPGFPHSPLVHTFFQDTTATWTFLVTCPGSRDAILVDPALDYDPASGKVETTTAKGIMAFVREMGYKVVRIIETHVHADHLTAAQVWRNATTPATPVCIGKRVIEVQERFGPVYGISASAYEGSFDVLFEDDATFKLGALEASVMHLPGHTPDHIGIRVGDAVFAGDSLFLPDVGSARVDFPGGSASTLYASVQRLLALPPTTRIFSGHDYPNSREKSCFSTVASQKSENQHVRDGISLKEFADMREKRDKGLGAPKLLHPSLQVNLRGGRLPERDEEGRRFMKTPVEGDLEV